MPKALKWIIAVFAGLLLLIVAAVLIAPMVIDLDRFKPRIEREASTALGRPVTIGGKIEPSVFPWIGVAVHDLHLGNPDGFEQSDFASVGLFEIRVRLWPLLSGEYEVKQFVVNDPRIVLIRQKDGRANWEGLGGDREAEPKAEPQEPAEKDPFAIKRLEVEQFAITNGILEFIDLAAGARHDIQALELRLDEISLVRPIKMAFSAVVDGHPVRLDGTVGPVGEEPGQGPLDIDLVAKLRDRLQINLQGRIENLMDAPRAGLNIKVAPFSLRALMADLKQPLPIETADKDALTRIELAMKLSGTADQISTEGELVLDQSRMNFSAAVKEFERPNIQMQAALDRIDVDRYLPPPAEEGQKPAEPQKAPPAKKTDYTPLRKMVLDAQIKVGELKVQNARTSNIELRARANNGVIRLDPMTIDLYEGRISGKSTIDVRQDTPRSEMGLSIGKVLAGPLLRDVMNKDIIEGALNADISIQMVGDAAEQIRRTLNGKGELTFTDGAIVGIDLAGMVRNAQAAFGLAEKPTERPRTDFSEFAVPFTMTDGTFQLNNARLTSPLLRVSAGGKADLVKETLDIRVQPAFVATLKGQGDVKERTGIMVPVLVGGTFEDPKFRPDLKAMLQQELPDRETLKQMIPEDLNREKVEERLKEKLPGDEELKKELEKKGQDLLKGLIPRKKEE
jgi:AsmA protein